MPSSVSSYFGGPAAFEEGWGDQAKEKTVLGG